MSEVKTSLALWGDRHIPPAAIAAQARAMQDAGVDGMLLADQLGNFIPPQLWTADNAPSAAMLDDPDSHSDVFALAGYLLAAAPKLDVTVSADSVRRGPAELLQGLLTLANMTEGEVALHVGGGEAKQCQPFGHKRSQGMSRMEDLFQITAAMLDDPATPLDFHGRRWTYQRASIGGAIPKRPKILGLGGGPMLIDHCTSYADGLATTCPPVWAGADKFAAAREEILRTVAGKGRDPHDFEFAVWFPALIAADEPQLQRHMDNPLIKWLAAVFGRIEPPEWESIGLENPFPHDWRYYKDLLPQDTTDEFIESVLGKVTDDHVKAGWVCGTVEQVADQVRAYVDAGANWVCPMDYLPIVLEPVEAPAAFARSLQTLALIRP
jgi:phthiodiolone/phenolphthiodiolone dimycocerosates ketoreductase